MPVIIGIIASSIQKGISFIKKLLVGFSDGTLRTSSGNLTSFDTSLTLFPNFWNLTTTNFGTTIATSIQYGNNLFVAAGQTGQIRTTTDGITWTTRTSNFGTTHIFSVDYGNSLWVAAGNTGQIRTSTDGTTWTTRTSNFGTTRINLVKYQNNLWVAAGLSGELRTSTDAITWTTRTSNFGTTTIWSVDYGNSLWVAGGELGELRTSTDAITWTTRTSNFGTTTINFIKYGNNLFVALGGSTRRTSTDGITWTTQTSVIENTQDIEYGNNLFIAMSGNTIHHSTDGLSWITSSAQGVGVPNGRTLESLAYGNGLWIAVADQGSGQVSRTSQKVIDVRFNSINSETSADEIHLKSPIIWTSINFNSDLYDSAYGHNQWIMTGAIRASSTDGITWTTSPANATALKIEYGNGIFVDVRSISTVFRSTDGTTWTTQSTGGTNETVSALKYGNGLWMASGSGTNNYITSTDAITWVTRTALGSVNAIQYGNGVWIVVGNSGLIQTSTDAITWTTRTSNFGATNILSIGYANNLWVAAGPARTVRRSTDTVTWTTVSTSAPFNTSPDSFKGIAFGNGLWLFAAENGNIYASEAPGSNFQLLFGNMANVINFSGFKYNNGLWILNNSSTSVAISKDIKQDFYTAFSDSGVAIISTDLITWGNWYLFNLRPINAGKFLIAGANDVQSNWVTRTSNFGTTTIQDVAYGNNLFIAVGDTGQIRTSSDATSWTTQTSNFGTTGIKSIGYGNNLWVAGGSAGSGVRTSTDGITWVTRTSPYTSAGSFGVINKTAYNDNLFVQIGSFLDGIPEQRGMIVTSTDTITWTSRYTYPTESDFSALNYGNDKWIAMEYFSGRPVVSTDGITWTTTGTNAASFYVRSMAYGNGKFFALGGQEPDGIFLKYTTDGSFWQSVELNSSIASSANIGYFNGLWLIYGRSNKFYTSTDGFSWVSRAIGNDSETISRVIHGVANRDGVLVLVGENGKILTAAAEAPALSQIVAPDFSNISITNALYSSNPNGIFTDHDVYLNSVAFPFSKSGPVTGLASMDQPNKKLIGSSAGYLVGTDQGLKPFYSFYSLFKEVNQTTWVTNTSNFGNTSIRKIKYGNNLYVIVGDSGQIRTGSTATDWTTRTSNFGTSAINDLEYANGLFIAVGSGGTARTSRNGTSWTTQTSNFGATAISGIAYGKDLYVAVGDAGQIRTTTDGITWTTRTSNFGVSNINKVAYGSGSYVAVGVSGQLRTSTDGITWTTRTSNYGTTNIGAIGYGSGFLLAGGTPAQIRTSTNGITWTTQTAIGGTVTIHTIKYGAGRWRIGGANYLATSTNAASWTAETSGLSTATSSIFAIEYDNYVWTVGGGSPQDISNQANAAPHFDNIKDIKDSKLGRFYILSAGKLYYVNSVIPSNLGLVDMPQNTEMLWNTQITDFGLEDIYTLEYGNQIYLAAGTNGRLSTSTDAITWTTRTSNFGTTSISSVAYGNSLWVAGGGFGGVPELRTSTDAITWTTRTSNLGNVPQSIGYGNGLWVAGANNGFMSTSTDGITWTTRTSNFGNTSICRVFYDNNLWIAAGVSGQLRTSTDGITWTTQTSNFGTTTTIWAVDYGNSLWVAGGDSGQIRTSTDGVTWTTRASNLNPNTNIYAIDYGNGIFVLAGGRSSIATSTDGITWITRPSLYTNNDDLSDILYGNGIWLASSNDGKLKTSNNPLTNGVVTAIADGIFATNDGYVYRSNGNTGKFEPFATNLPYHVEDISENYLGALNGTDQNIALFIDGKVPSLWTTSSWGDTGSAGQILYGNNVYVLGGFTEFEGQFPFLRTSTDLITWTSRSMPGSPTTEVHSLAYGNGIYLAGLGAGQPIYRSTDSTVWTTHTSNLGSERCMALNYGNGIYVAGGFGGSVRTSTDGATWTTRTSNFGTTSIQSVAYGNSLWIAGGDSGQIRTSTDAITWTTRTSNFGTTTILSIEYANNLFIAGGNLGELRTSTDGVSWITRVSGFGNANINKVSYGNNIWTISGLDRLSTSSDTIVWNAQYVPTTSSTIRAIYGNGIWVASAGAQIVSAPINNNVTGIYLSNDFITWTSTKLNLPVSNDLITDIG